MTRALRITVISVLGAVAVAIVWVVGTVALGLALLAALAIYFHMRETARASRGAEGQSSTVEWAVLVVTLAVFLWLALCMLDTKEVIRQGFNDTTSVINSRG